MPEVSSRNTTWVRSLDAPPQNSCAVAYTGCTPEAVGLGLASESPPSPGSSGKAIDGRGVPVSVAGSGSNRWIRLPA